MAGFPLMWEEEVLGPVAEDGCPVTADVIRGYLEDCSHKYLLEDPLRSFGLLHLELARGISHREFWIWTCADTCGETWFVVASSGLDDPRRWVFAERAGPDTTAEDVFKQTLRDIALAAAQPQ